MNTDLQLIVVPSGNLTPSQSASYSGRGWAAWNYSHFVEHIHTAAVWLGIPQLRIEASVWHDVMQMGSASQAGQAILVAAEAWAANEVAPKYSAKQLYQPDGVAELTRHLKEGVRF